MQKEIEQKIGQLQLFEQSVQNLLMQKQQFQMQLAEIDSALKELDNTKEAYKIVGNIMVLKRKEELEKDLKEKKEVAQLRIKSMDKQESQIKEKASKLQEEVLKNIKNEQ